MRITETCSCGAAFTYCGQWDTGIEPDDPAGKRYDAWLERHKDCKGGGLRTSWGNPQFLTVPACEHQWVTDTGGTRCAKCGRSPGQPSFAVIGNDLTKVNT